MIDEYTGKTIVSPLDLTSEKIEKLAPMQYRIVEEIIEAINILGGKNDLTTPLCSWGDTISERAVLEMVTQWNEANRVSKPSSVLVKPANHPFTKKS